MIKLKKGIPVPSRKSGSGVMAALRAMKVNKEHFDWSKTVPSLYNYAKEVGIKIRVEKQPDGTHRVWRVK